MDGQNKVTLSLLLDPVEEIKMNDPMMEEDHSMMDETHDDEMTEDDLGSVLRLSRANVPATIPMHQGYYNGESVYFIITDSSDPTHAEIITANQGWQVELAPLLKNTPDEALSKTYLFTNGIEGKPEYMDIKVKSSQVHLHRQMYTAH